MWPLAFEEFRTHACHPRMSAIHSTRDCSKIAKCAARYGTQAHCRSARLSYSPAHSGCESVSPAAVQSPPAAIAAWRSAANRGLRGDCRLRVRPGFRNPEIETVVRLALAGDHFDDNRIG